MIEGPAVFAAKLYPRHVQKMRRLMKVLQDYGDGDKASFADAVRWMIDLPEVAEAVDKFVASRKPVRDLR